MPNYGIPPVALARGKGCRVWDADGREYPDLIAGIAVCSLGHAHPAIVEAVSRQVAPSRTRPTCSCTSARSHWPSGCSGCSAGGHPADGRVFFANSGTEANEAAVKLVRRRQGPGQTVIVAADGSFHGRTWARSR